MLTVVQTLAGGGAWVKTDEGARKTDRRTMIRKGNVSAQPGGDFSRSAKQDESQGCAACRKCVTDMTFDLRRRHWPFPDAARCAGERSRNYQVGSDSDLSSVGRGTPSAFQQQVLGLAYRKKPKERRSLGSVSLERLAFWVFWNVLGVLVAIAPIIRAPMSDQYIPGSDLLSHAPAHAVPSAVADLTSVFGMGTGVTLLL